MVWSNEQKREYNRKYREANRDKLRAQETARRLADPDRERRKYKQYYERHKEKIKAKKRDAHRAYYAEHRDEILAKTSDERAQRRLIARAMRDEAGRTGKTKWCPVCRMERSVADFHIDGARGDGLRDTCGACHTRAQRARYRERSPYEHRRILEAVLGRKLMAREQVHHVNCDHADNRPDNLWPCSLQQHGLAHGSLERLVRPLMEAGVILFDRSSGTYALGQVVAT